MCLKGRVVEIEMSRVGKSPQMVACTKKSILEWMFFDLFNSAL